MLSVRFYTLLLNLSVSALRKLRTNHAKSQEMNVLCS